MDNQLRRRDSFKDLLREKAEALSKPESYLQVQEGRGLEKACHKRRKMANLGFKHEIGRKMRSKPQVEKVASDSRTGTPEPHLPVVSREQRDAG